MVEPVAFGNLADGEAEIHRQRSPNRFLGFRVFLWGRLAGPLKTVVFRRIHVVVDHGSLLLEYVFSVICALLSNKLTKTSNRLYNYRMNTNFKKMIEALREARYSDSMLAQECDCSRQQIYHLRTGVTENPTYKIGRKIEELYEALQ